MSGAMAVLSWIAIREGCPISYRISDDSSDTDFCCGELSDCVEFTFDAPALREFVRLGSEALERLATRDEYVTTE